MAKQAAGPPPMPFAWIALFPPRVVRDLVAHHREHDVAQLPRHGRDGHAVGLALGALPVVEGAQPRVVPPGAVGRQPQSAAKVRRAVLGYGAAAAVEPPGLAHRRVQPGVAHQGGRVAEARHVAYLGDYLGARDAGHPGYRQHERLDLVEQGPQPRLDPGALGIRELDLPYQGLDLERGRLLAGPHADRRLGRGLDLRGVAGRLAAAPGRLGDVAGERVGAPPRQLEGQRGLGQHRAAAGPEHVREYPGVLGEVGVHQAYALGLELRHHAARRLQAARQRPQRRHLAGGEPGLVALAYAQRLGYEPGVDAVVLDLVEPLELAHRLDLHGVYHGDRVAPGDEERVARHPVVAGGLHAHDDVGRRPRKALEPRDGPLEPGLGVLERHRRAHLRPALVDRPYDVVRLGDVHTRVDHSRLPSAMRRGLPERPGPQPPKRDPRWRVAPHPANSRPFPNGAGCHSPLRGRTRRLSRHVGIPARQSLHCI